MQAQWTAVHIGSGFSMDHANPGDYWCWTGSGLRKLLKERDVEHTVGILGFAAAALALMQDALAGPLPRILRVPFEVVLQRFVKLVDMCSMSRRTEWRMPPFISSWQGARVAANSPVARAVEGLTGETRYRRGLLGIVVDFPAY